MNKNSVSKVSKLPKTTVLAEADAFYLAKKNENDNTYSSTQVSMKTVTDTIAGTLSDIISESMIDEIVNRVVAALTPDGTPDNPYALQIPNWAGTVNVSLPSTTDLAMPFDGLVFGATSTHSDVHARKVYVDGVLVPGCVSAQNAGTGIQLDAGTTFSVQTANNKQYYFLVPYKYGNVNSDSFIINLTNVPLYEINTNITKSEYSGYFQHPEWIGIYGLPEGNNDNEGNITNTQNGSYVQFTAAEYNTKFANWKKLDSTNSTNDTRYRALGIYAPLSSYSKYAINFSVSYVKWTGSRIGGGDIYATKKKIIPLKKSYFVNSTDSNKNRLWVFWRKITLKNKEGYPEDMSGSFNLISFDNDNS